ncbi:RHE_PE00001 family protein [Methylobacterium sp. EM32]|uniref:RHE_PE00001 family protein n=1 Tax=Methylobacterium sp. EM32 TaxID=3163481 RepID=UPI0033A9C524
MVYDVDAIRLPAAWRGLTVPLEAASDALVRLDERLARADPVLADGARARAHLFDAQAALHLDGELVALEDLVLHEAAMDVRRPTLALSRAVAVLTERRRLAAAAPGWAFSDAGWGLLAGPGPDAEDDAEETEEPDFAAIDRLLARTRRTLADHMTGAPTPRAAPDDPLARWQRILDETRDLPALLAAAIALDAWLVLDPAPRRGHRGPLLAAALLRARGKAGAHLPALSLGLREARARWSQARPLPDRLTGLLGAVEASARAVGRDLDRLALAREVMLRACAGRRRTSRLPQLVDLFVGTPLVTVASAARALAVSPQAVEGMLAELGAARPRELTERRRYRAWGIV